MIRVRTSMSVGIALWALALAPMTMAVVPTSLPPRFFDLIRADRAADARALAERELADLPATAPPLKRCEAMEHVVVLVTAFEFGVQQPVVTQRTTEALECWKSLPGERARAFATVWALRAAQAQLYEGEVQRGLAAAAGLRKQFETLQHRLPPFERALGLATLGQTDYWRGDLEGAVRDYRAAVAALDGGDSAEQIMQAGLYSAMSYYLERSGHLGDALQAAQHAVEQIAPPRGAPKTHVARTLGALGAIEFQANRWDSALGHADAAIAILRPLGAPVHDLLGYSLLTRSNALNASGRTEEALAPLLETITLQRAKSKPVATRLAVYLNQLGNLQLQSGAIDAAEASFKESSALCRETAGEHSERCYGTESNLSNIALERGDFGGARLRIDAVIARVEMQFGKGSERLPELLSTQGNIAYAQGDFTAAVSIHRRALAILPALSGVLSADRYLQTRGLARSLHGLGNDAEAFASAVAAEQLRQQLLHDLGSHLGSEHALALQSELAGTLDMVLALVSAHPDPDWIRQAWKLEIGARQSITSLIGARLRAARASADAQTQALWQRYESASEDYASATLDGHNDATAIAQRHDALDSAERALADRVGAVAQARAGIDADVAALTAALPAHSALSAYVFVPSDPWQPEHRRAQAQAPADGGRYYAFVMAPQQAPQLVDLGAAATIAQAVTAWQTVLRDPQRELAEVDRAGVALRKLVWDPLRLPTTARWFAVPAGDLYRVSWLPLPLAQGRMIDTGPLPQLLDSERDLLVAAAPTKTGSLLLVGAPSPAAVSRNDSACVPGALPGATRELDDLRALWRDGTQRGEVKVLTGDAALEAPVRRAMQTSGMLHFATHTLTDNAPCADLLASRSVHLVDAAASASVDSAARGALLLTATPSPHDAIATAQQDGLLTPAEVATLDLSRASWVVLSACDTGAGAVTPEEGVFGLRRAFRLAGARSVVMSLWPVDDEATADLMRRLYRHRLQDRDDVPAALTGAAREVLAARRAKGLSTHPYYWAGFVASGDWR